MVFVSILICFVSGFVFSIQSIAILVLSKASNSGLSFQYYQY